MLSVIIPAHNEEQVLGATLKSLLNSDAVVDANGNPVPVEVIVVANGCTDRTVQVAQAASDSFHKNEMRLVVIDLEEGSKTGALRSGEAQATGEVTAYLDADILLSPALLGETWRQLANRPAAWGSGISTICEAQSRFTEAYRRFYNNVPFRKDTIPGGGFFAVNKKGRERWGKFPDIIADDLFVRLNFAPQERILIDAPFYWRLAEGMNALVRARRRQDRGTRELAAKFPELFQDEDKPAFTPAKLLGMAARDITGFVAYVSVRLAANLFPGKKERWSRGR